MTIYEKFNTSLHICMFESPRRQIVYESHPREHLKVTCLPGESYRSIKEFSSVRVLYLRSRDNYTPELKKILRYCPQINTLNVYHEYYEYRDDDDQDVEFDMRGISTCVNLNELKLVVPRLKYLEELSFCSYLKKLSLSVEMEKKDWGALIPSVCESLEILELKRMDISTLRNSTLKCLTSLKKVAIVSCSPLANLQLLRNIALEKLECNNCELGSLEGICTNELVVLKVPSNDLTCVKPLRGAKKLKKLYICNNRIRSIRHLLALELEHVEDFHGLSATETTKKWGIECFALFSSAIKVWEEESINT